MTIRKFESGHSKL